MHPGLLPSARADALPSPQVIGSTILECIFTLPPHSLAPVELSPCSSFLPYFLAALSVHFWAFIWFLGSPPPHPDSLFTFLIDLDYHAELQVLCMWDSWSHHLPGSWAHISLYTSQMPPMPQPQEGLPLPPSAAPFPTPDSLCSLISSLELQGT